MHIKAVVSKWIVPLGLVLILACESVSQPDSDSKPISHEQWNALLKKHVKDNGMVDYKGFMEDSVQLQKYLALLESRHPNDKHWSGKEQLAYWINAYNAFTVELVLKHYPIESIKDITKGPNIPFINSPWDVKFITIEGEEYDLNNLEHGIIRDQFNEPRIHFAVNCASISCPVLRGEAYTPEKLDEQLTDQARIFINNPSRNKIKKNRVVISKIFRWYTKDFKDNGTLIDYLNKYSKTKINQDADIDYMDYNWKLNDVGMMGG